MPQPHEKLTVYKFAISAWRRSVAFTQGLPPGFSKDIDQLRRASSSVVRNIAEGAARWSPADKAARFVVARGEAAEAAAVVDMLLAIDVGDRDVGLAILDDLDRVGAMLTRLAQRHGAR